MPAGAQKKVSQPSQPEVRNIIFMIGDGMGLTQVAATAVNNGNKPLYMERARYVGLVRTYSANNRVTDSAAAGTALATGTKTNNGSIGVDPDGNVLESTLEKAAKAGYATGVVVTYSVTNATPAAFLAHERSRKSEDEIAVDILDSGVDVFVGGGTKFFMDREDGRDLVKDFEKKGYKMSTSLDELFTFNKGRIGMLLAANAMKKTGEGRGDYLPRATAKVLDILRQNSAKGFFVMIEGSQIDGGGHANDARVVFDETNDFDQAVKAAFDFADANPGTLVVVTADHETGGLTIPSGKPDFSLPDQGVQYQFSTKGHTGVYVPLFAYGTGAENFTGVMDNTDVPKKMQRLLNLK